MIDRRAVVAFLIVAFGVAWVLFLVPIAFGPVGSQSRQWATLGFWSLAMWAPGLGALIATRFVARERLGVLNLGRLGPKRPYLWAWLLPPALAVIAGVLTVLLGAGQLDLSFSAIGQAMAQTSGGSAIPAALVVAIQVLVALTIGPLFNTLLGLGEELGWRGFLLPRLLPLGQWPAIILSGVVWGIWHAPAIAQGHNYPGHPVLGIFMMVVFTVLAGAIFSWLYLRTRSPWAPALAHGSLNASAGLPVLFLVGVDISIGGTIASAIGWIPLAAFVGWLVYSRRLPVGETVPLIQQERPAEA